MEFDDAIFYDKRKFYEHFSQILKEKQDIAYTFINHDDLRPRTIKIIGFVLDLTYLLLSYGLAFSESKINELYEINEEEVHFFSYILMFLASIIYCVLNNMTFGIFVDLILIQEEKLKGILKREKDNKNILKQKINEFIKDVQKRNIAFIIISFIILAFSFFYLLCFNYAYPYSQIEWIKASITIVIILQIASILRCFLITSLRFLSFKCRIEKLYKISKILLKIKR